MKQNKRFQTGLEKFREIDKSAVEKIIDELKDVSPE